MAGKGLHNQKEVHFLLTSPLICEEKQLEVSPHLAIMMVLPLTGVNMIADTVWDTLEEGVVPRETMEVEAAGVEATMTGGDLMTHMSTLRIIPMMVHTECRGDHLCSATCLTLGRVAHGIAMVEAVEGGEVALEIMEGEGLKILVPVG